MINNPVACGAGAPNYRATHPGLGAPGKMWHKSCRCSAIAAYNTQLII